MTVRAAAVRGTVIRPTAFGVTATAVAAAVVATRSSINDPVLAALVWTVFAGLVVIGMVWPVVMMRFVRVELHDVPVEAVAGREVRLDIEVHTPVLVDTVALRVEGTTDDAWWSLPSGRSVLTVAPNDRGVYPQIHVTVTGDGPLGMMSVARRIAVPLDRPVFVGPDPIAQEWSGASVPDSGTDDRSGGSAGGGDQVRSVRPYRSGDPSHLVHWPSTARIGSLVVRELEPPARPGVVLVVDLGPATTEHDDHGAASGSNRSAHSEDAVEQAVRRASGLAAAVLGSGGGVILCTSEDGVPVAAEIATASQLLRRLAAAGPGPVGAPRGSGEWTTVTVVSTPGGSARTP